MMNKDIHSQPPEVIAITHKAIKERAALAQDMQDNHPERAIALAEEVQKLSTALEPPYEQGIAQALVIQAQASLNMGRYEMVIAAASEASVFSENSGLRETHRSALHILGVVYQHLGDYVLSTDYLLKALVLAEQSSDTTAQFIEHNAIGVTLSMSGDIERGLEYFENCLRFAEQSDNIPAQASNNNNCCVSYRHIKQYEKALKHGQRALELYQKLGHKRGELHAIGNLGEVYLEMGDYNRAVALFEKRLAEVGEFKGLKVHTLHNMGQLYNHRAQYDRAIACLNEGLALAEQMSTPIYIHRCHEQLAYAYRHSGDFEQALHHYEQFHTVKETLNNEESRKRFQNLEVIHRTQHMQMEVDLERSRRKQDKHYFERLSQMKDDFINAVSHDLKTPLATINTLLHLLARHGITSDTKGEDYINRLKQQVNQMRDLITDLLDLAQLETGRAMLPDDISLLLYLQDIIDGFTAIHQRTIHFQHPDDDIHIYFDSTQLRQVMNNLLSNALKYSSDGDEITVEVDLVSEEVLVKIIDRGIGIPAEELPRIFENFYRVQREETTTIEGTGLGLAIVKSIVEQHGGKVWVESTLGQGSAFQFTIPLQSAARNESLRV